MVVEQILKDNATEVRFKKKKRNKDVLTLTHNLFIIRGELCLLIINELINIFS